MRKKLFAILMSAMMMVTFMPAMAFASPADNVTSDNPLGHEYELDKDASTIAKCGAESKLVYKCELDGCAATKVVYAPGKHNFTAAKTIRTNDLPAVIGGIVNGIEEYLGLPINPTVVADIVAWLQSEVCWINVPVCADCGTIGFNSEADLKAYVKALRKLDRKSVIFGEHKYSGAACAEEGVCQYCGTVMEHTPTVTHANVQNLVETLVEAASGKAKYLTTSELIKVQNKVKAGTDDWANLKIEEIGRDCCGAAYWYGIKCADCGKQLYSFGVTTDGSEQSGTFKHKFTVKTDEKEAGKYYAKANKDGTEWFEIKLNEGQEVTCVKSGKGKSVCTICGKQNGNKDYTVDKLGHDLQRASVAANCWHAGYTLQYCTRCWEYNLVTPTPGEDQLSHNYTITELTAPTCDTNGQFKISCDKCGYTAYYQDYNSPHFAKVEGKQYFFGWNDELHVNVKELPAIEAVGKHVFGAAEKIADATCTNAEMWAIKCTVCGEVDHATIVREGAPLGHTCKTVVVAPTCGDYGYSYNVCAVCHKYLNKSGKHVEDGMVKFDAVEPKVSLGAACTEPDEWTTTVPATFTKVGTRVKVCPICGTQLAKDDIAKLTLKRAYIPKLVAGSKKITVKVTKETKNATGYQIAYKVAGNNNYKFVKTTNLSKTIKNLKKGTKYCFKIRAYAVEDGKTYYGAYCTVKYCKAK